MSQQNNLEDLYLQSYSFTTAAAIIGSVDRKVFCLLRDGRTIVGILRTFDQFANLVIHDGIQRIYLQEEGKYAESDKPEIYLIRGENVVMLGELDIDKEDEPLEKLIKIDFDEVKAKIEEIHSKKIQNEIKNAKLLHEAGITSEFTKGDLY
ncbi:hypothetical protein B5S32_g1815 [[Candida] boidinii]|nr:hypothetical protein B5S32_g1815 [[Candida] boidinii]